jgi:hypothetical protein
MVPPPAIDDGAQQGTDCSRYCVQRVEQPRLRGRGMALDPTRGSLVCSLDDSSSFNDITKQGSVACSDRSSGRHFKPLHLSNSPQGPYIPIYTFVLGITRSLCLRMQEFRGVWPVCITTGKRTGRNACKDVR